MDKIHTLICTNCECLNPTNTNLCLDCGNRIVLDKKTREKSILVSAIIEYHRWSERQIDSFSSISKTEKMDICKKTREKLEELLAIYKNTREEVDDKGTLSLIDNKMMKLTQELGIIDKLAASVDKC